MGSDHEEAYTEEQPVHRVTLVRGFYIGIHPVTQAQWKAVMGTNPSSFKGPERPVECVSWDDSQEFCRKLSAHLKGQVSVRLPWEAEWEYACRAGTTTEFHFGDVINTDLANYDGNYSWNGSSDGQYRAQTTNVGSFPPNAWGLFDVHGNVWEWCEDWFSRYAAAEQTDPVRLQKHSVNCRIRRGGSWGDDPDSCRAAYRSSFKPCYRYKDAGLRVCFRLDGPSQEIVTDEAQPAMPGQRGMATGKPCPNCGRPLVRDYSTETGRGFVGCSGRDDKESPCNYIKPSEGDPGRVAPVETEHRCPTCGKPMLLKTDHYGQHLACSGRPTAR